MTKPKIYVWCNSCARDWHTMCAMAEDGTYLAGHVCSNHSFAQHDMGFTSQWKHEKYDAHYPDGWELEWVDDPRNHPGLMAAYERNQARAKNAEAAS